MVVNSEQFKQEIAALTTRRMLQHQRGSAKEKQDLP